MRGNLPQPPSARDAASPFEPGSPPGRPAVAEVARLKRSGLAADRTRMERSQGMGRARRLARRWAQAARPAPRLRFPERFRVGGKSPYPFAIDTDNPLEALGRKYGPTKRIHYYLPYYWMHLRDIREQVRNVCEIGVQSDRSIRMWEDFFPRATIWGVDIDPKVRAFEGGRRRIRIGDQSDRHFLAALVDEAPGGFDVVIDDASHNMRHQLITFDALFPALTDHGLYVIEDTGGMSGCRKTVERMKQLVDGVMYWPADWDPTRWAQLARLPEGAGWAARHTIGVAFYRWIIFIYRGHNPEDNPYLKSR